jgi:hypothetical protein
MPILDGDIKLLSSQVLDDVPEGGGLATGNEIVDGVSNNLFNDISELDRTYGRISLRKVFPAVTTLTTDGYYGAHVIIAEAPADPLVSASLFTTGSPSDVRTDAANRLESYLALGAESRYQLYGNHLVGQRSVQVRCDRATASPGIGDVLGLVQRDDEEAYQFVRVTRILSRLVDVLYSDSGGDYLMDLMALEISDALRLAFDGATAQRYTDDWFNPKTRVHETFAADATNYYGVSPLAQAADVGDLTLRAESVYTQLVPSALAETPIIDARCTGDRTLLVPITGAAPLSFESALSTNPGQPSTRYFGRAFARTSLVIAVDGIELVDDGAGGIVPNAGFSGTVDYAVGSVTLAHSAGINSTIACTATLAAAVAVAGHTDRTPISVGNRGYNYVKNFSPAPAPGSVSVDYRALGKWYRLVDNGSGGLSGDDGVGTGLVDYATGSLVVTLGALPDVDTQVLFTWGAPAHYTPRVGASVFAAPAVRIEVPGGALSPSNLTITYLAGGVTKTVTDNGIGGLTGHGTGWVDYANGVISLLPSLLPDSDSDLVTSYRQGVQITEVHAAGGASNNFSLAQAVLPKSVTLTFQDSVGGEYTVRDDGAGALALIAASLSATGNGSEGGTGDSSVSVAISSTAGIAGSINYATGAVALGASIVLSATSQARVLTGLFAEEDFNQTRTWSTAPTTVVASGNITATYRAAGNTHGAPQQLSQTLPALRLDLLPTVSNTLVAGSMRFTLGGSVYLDRAGALLRDVSAETNSGTYAGTVNYTSGGITLADYTGGGAPTVSVEALTRKGLWEEWRFSFRVTGAPLQPASLALRANRAADGVLVSVASDLAGSLDGAESAGTVDAQLGIVEIDFGALVLDSGLTVQEKAEWWYDPSRVVEGYIFRPTLMLPDTALYNAVAVSNLPLSAEILGLDPVRLPVDGRVPMLRPGDVLVIHHSATTAPATVSNAQTVNLGRTRLARLRVIGANDATISTGYTQDLDAGTVTFVDVAGYSQPVRIEHRVEDMALCSDAQINGELRVTRALTHEFPLGSLVSSALILGDLHARVSLIFDQETWANEWADAPIGPAAAASFNSVQYPITVTNRSALTERWMVVFTNTTTVNVLGETVGQIVTGHAITNALAPLNPATGTAYFSVPALGWGAGWEAGNALRFNTVAANFPVWVARTVLQGPPTEDDDSFTIGIRGDVDQP